MSTDSRSLKFSANGSPTTGLVGFILYFRHISHSSHIFPMAAERSLFLVWYSSLFLQALSITFISCFGVVVYLSLAILLRPWTNYFLPTICSLQHGIPWVSLSCGLLDFHKVVSLFGPPLIHKRPFWISSTFPILFSVLFPNNQGMSPSTTSVSSPILCPDRITGIIKLLTIRTCLSPK